MTEGVGHLVSEKGRQGVSPSTASNGNAIRQRLNSSVSRKRTLLVSAFCGVVSNGAARYRDQSDVRKWNVIWVVPRRIPSSLSG